MSDSALKNLVSRKIDRDSWRKNYVSDCSIRNQHAFNAVADCLLDSGGRVLNTKEIADKCNLSIYTARHYLMKLEKNNVVDCKKNEKCHEWCLKSL
ncbi:hypothetical protein F3J29_12795 [Enterobacter sp. Cy-643]|uniref:FaeA/PapI family transcriptional regulator n=1 Tax=Enterobacter sp. Cy-643 TaxID=2608346 RepID=UPI00142360C3|nr:hypothetical protein [Enterobacter sp. Cy-643]